MSDAAPIVPTWKLGHLINMTNNKNNNGHEINTAIRTRATK
jgi:hypothetical protein